MSFFKNRTCQKIRQQKHFRLLTEYYQRVELRTQQRLNARMKFPQLIGGNDITSTNNNNLPSAVPSERDGSSESAEMSKKVDSLKESSGKSGTHQNDAIVNIPFTTNPSAVCLVLRYELQKARSARSDFYNYKTEMLKTNVKNQFFKTMGKIANYVEKTVGLDVNGDSAQSATSSSSVTGPGRPSSDSISSVTTSTPTNKAPTEVTSVQQVPENRAAGLQSSSVDSTHVASASTSSTNRTSYLPAATSTNIPQQAFTISARNTPVFAEDNEVKWIESAEKKVGLLLEQMRAGNN